MDVDDETEFVSSGNGAKGKAKIKAEVEKKKKKDTKCDIPTLKLRTSSRLLPHMRFLATALKDAYVKYDSFKATFASIYDIFTKVQDAGIVQEDSVEIHKHADSDQVGLIKLLDPYGLYTSKSKMYVSHLPVDRGLLDFILILSSSSSSSFSPLDLNSQIECQNL